MNDRRPLDDDELLSAIDAAESTATSHLSGIIASDRADALDRYYGREYSGDLAAAPGRSSVVSRDVADVVEGVLANVIKPFVGGDKVVQFDPLGPDDEDQAQQETDYINYIALQRNNGFLTLNAACKDALLLRSGYVKMNWTTRSDIITETYVGQSDDQLAIVAQDKDVEITQHSEYPDPSAPMPDPMQMQQMAMQAQQAGQPFQPPKPPMLHDVKLRRTRPTEFVETCPAPPDEILISQRSRSPSLQDCDFVQHRTHLMLSELRQMGYEVDDDITDDFGEESIEDISRQRFGERGTLFNDDTQNRARRLVLFKESWIRIDRDGDGIAELRRVCQVGRTLLNDEEADLIPIAAFSCVVMPHQHLGMSVYDMVQDLARLKTALMRAFMDNKYLASNPQSYVDVQKMGDYMDDYLISRPGGIRRVNGNPSEAILQSEYPDTGPSALQGLEYLDSVRENRTGYTRQSQGLETDALVSKTVGGMVMQLSQSQLRLEMMARSIAETGVRDMFRIIHALTLKYSSRAEKVRLNGKWVQVNPREWVRRTDLSITVGIGSASQQQMQSNLMLVASAQEKAMPLGLVTPTNVYNLTKKLVTSAGFRSVEEFFTAPQLDPQTGQPKPPPQQKPPEVQVAEIKAQAEQAAKQADLQLEGQRLQMESQAKQQQQSGALELQRSNDQRQVQLDQHRFELQLQADAQKHSVEQDTQVRLANIKAASAAQVARIAKGYDDGSDLLTQQEQGAGYTHPLAQMLQAFHAALTAPKQVVRDQAGRVVGVQTVQQPTVQ